MDCLPLFGSDALHSLQVGHIDALNLNATQCTEDSANAKHCITERVMIKLMSRLEKVLLVMVITSLTTDLEGNYLD